MWMYTCVCVCLIEKNREIMVSDLEGVLQPGGVLKSLTEDGS